MDRSPKASDVSSQANSFFASMISRMNRPRKAARGGDQSEDEYSIQPITPKHQRKVRRFSNGNRTSRPTKRSSPGAFGFSPVREHVVQLADSCSSDEMESIQALSLGDGTTRPKRKATTEPATSKKCATPKDNSIFLHSSSSDESTLEAGLFDVFASPGYIGMILNTTKHGPVVHSLKPTSPMLGLINPGDYIVRLDDQDTRGMTADTLTKLMAKKANQRERKITLFAAAP